MAQVIEFDTLARFTPTVKWASDKRRGKVIPFMPQREMPDQLACAAHEELDSESSCWPELDEALYQAALEQAQPPGLEEERLLQKSSSAMAKRYSVSSIPGFFSNGSLIGS
jgi:hypothetical protein